MSVERKGDYIVTYSGREFYPLDPRAEDVVIEDIAHALANLCRFTGHSRRFYSVAQHCCLVASHLPAELKMWGLLHNAAEAYLCDVARPVKHQPEAAFYREAEERVMAAICAKFDLPTPEPPAVKEVDARMLYTEKRDLLTPNPRMWKRPIEPYGDRILPLLPQQAEHSFLMSYFDYAEVPEQVQG